MLIWGGRLLLIAAAAWVYEAAVYLYGGGWPNIAWTDVFALMGGDYSIDLVASYLRTPTAFFKAPVGTSCFAAGLPIFLFGLAGWGEGKRKPA